MEFSCCHAFNKCDYGKLECIFATTDPNMKQRCRCYQIKHSPHYASKGKNEDTPGTEIRKTKQEVEEVIKTPELEQLSLF
ncbi:hypothetical protein [Robertmurraya sp. FSL R5-0851]|uniref:hypothetical protein n=1 Tax=Robertmurraya sp. FSL R5-0851 TaxID=2921584 RepID=UPI0030F5BEEA